MKRKFTSNVRHCDATCCSQLLLSEVGRGNLKDIDVISSITTMGLLLRRTLVLGNSIHLS